MKKIKKISVSMLMFRLCFNNTVFAATSGSGSSSKYVFIGIAVSVIILLLFLGYKMDTNDGGNETKVSNKIDKKREKISNKINAIKHNSGTYEADTETYESDSLTFNNEDLNSSIEYAEDDEDSLYSTSSESKNTIEYEDYTGDFSTENTMATPIVVDSEEPETKEETEVEEIGSDEFDTSIIDNLDEEDSKKSFDETMLFNTSNFSATGTNLEEEIDNLDSINEEKEDDDKNFLEELKKFEQPESTFEGFSVASNENKTEEFADEEENIFSLSEKEENSNLDNEFLSQMEATLKKNKAGRKATTRKTSRKKEDK